MRKATGCSSLWSEENPSCGVEDLVHAEKFSVRNLGDPGNVFVKPRKELFKMEDSKASFSVSGKSDSLIVPQKAPNKTRTTEAEMLEGRGLTKRNAHSTADGQTQSWNTITSRLMSVRRAAQKDKEAKLSSLLHHLTIPLLERSFYLLKRNSTPGIDDVSWMDYEKDLEENLLKLNRAIHTGAYKPKPARRIAIPKADGSERPISIQTIEDKIAQQAIVIILEQIYESDFLGFSYGFRPRRNQHDALDALHVGIMSKKINWILDLDIKKFFDTVDHQWLQTFLSHRIADKRVLRLITQWIKVGHQDDKGKRYRASAGVTQGAVISPLLSNVYLHYVYDLWVRQLRGRDSSGDMFVVRYADDSVLGFQNKGDVESFLVALKERMAKFGLELHTGNTRIIEFGRFAEEKRKKKGLGKPETFDFLGFTHYCGKTRKNNAFMVWRKTAKKRLNEKIKEIRRLLLRFRHKHVKETARWLSSIIQGHMNYYSVPGNGVSVAKFMDEMKRAWYKALCKRSQRKRLNWEKFGLYLEPLLPKFHVAHPYPEQRFNAKYSR